MSEKFILGIADYAIVGVMLAISAAIGAYFRISGGQQKTNTEYLLAGRNMSIFPVTFSMMATYMSAVTLMGMPAEMYLFGTHMAFRIIGLILGPVISSYIFLPIYFDTSVCTANEYLERRYGRTTRRLLSGIFLLKYALYNGVVLYAPALALSALTNFSIWTSVISIGTVCTFYCTVGGMKAVLWTDVFQSFLMYICVITIIVKGCMDNGGVSKIFEIANDGGRMVVPTFDLDFSTRYTMYSIFLQSTIASACEFSASQTQVQRQITLKHLKSAKIASITSGFLNTVFSLLCCFCGLIFYVYFRNCDPVTSPETPIRSADQLLPYYIVATMHQYPGLAGLCIAGIFSASLSSLSSGLNSMAAVTYEDIIRSLWPNNSVSVFITKIASIFYGILAIVVTILVASMGNIVKTCVLLLGMVIGPSFAVFLLAALTTTTTETGANLAMISGFLFAGCLTFIPNKRHYPELPMGNNCSDPTVNMFNDTMLDIIYDSSNYASTNTTSSSQPIVTTTNHPLPVDNLPLSYMWISTISFLFSVIVGYFGSWIISYYSGKTNKVPAILLSPARRRYLPKEYFIEDNVKEKVELLSPATVAL